MFRVSPAAALATALFVLSGCITPEPDGIPSEGDLTFHPAAGSIRGMTMDEILVQAEGAVEDAPLTTLTIRKLADQVRPAVVSIYVKTSQPYRVHLLPVRLPFLNGIPVRLPGQGLGSGFFIHSRGYILTNNHVVKNASEIHGLTSEGLEIQLEIIARDPIFDLALLRVHNPQHEFPVLPLAGSQVSGVGDHVVAVGNPLGLGHTITLGIISATGRHLQGVDPNKAKRIDFIQTDTAINPGSSGGPLINLNGHCVGVNTAGIQTAQNIGFAIPAHQVREFLEDVLEGAQQPPQ